MNGWYNIKAADFIDFNPHEYLSKDLPAKKVAMEKLQPFSRAITGYDIAHFCGGTKFRNGDTIMARITPCLENGKTAQVNFLESNEVGFGSTEFIVMRARPNVSDSGFIYYLATSPFFRNIAIQSMVGSSGRQRVQQDVLNTTELFVPSLSEQIEIGRTLRSLDDKIENNTKINHHLEQMAQAIFKSWFVDFEPFGGVMPSDWREAGIYSIADIIYGAPFASKLFNTDGKGKPIIRIRDLEGQRFVTYTTEVHPKGYLIQAGDIVVGMDGEFRPYIWGNDEAWLNQRVCIFANKRPKGKTFLYCLIKPLLFAVEQTQVATTVIHIGKKDFDAFTIFLPDDKTLTAFDNATDPMIRQIVRNTRENKRLVELRDTLLPRLMSGELSVANL